MVNCTSRPLRTLAEPQKPEISKSEVALAEAKTWRESFPTGKRDQSGDLFAILKSTGVRVETLAHTQRLRVYDVNCSLKNGENYECSYVTKPDAPKRFRLSSLESVKLADLLFSLPVSQGDSGASTSFIECLHAAPQTKSQPFCSIAIDLDYAGP